MWIPKYMFNEAAIIAEPISRCKSVLKGEITMLIKRAMPGLETPFKCYMYAKNLQKVLGEVECYAMEYYDEKFDGWLKEHPEQRETAKMMSFDTFMEKAVEYSHYTKKMIQKEYPASITAYMLYVTKPKIYEKPVELTAFEYIDRVGQVRIVDNIKKGWHYAKLLKEEENQ